MPGLADDLKLQNWLSILTYDAFKYAKIGGELLIEWTEEGLVLRLPGVQIDTEWVNSKFKKYVELTAENLAEVDQP